MSLDDTSTNPDINVPLDITKNPMKWDGNNARILGLLHETWLYYERNGLFDAFIQKRAKVLSNGKICCETVNHVPFVMGVIKEEDRTLANMCPPGDERIAQVNAYRAALTPPESPVHAITTMPAAHAGDVIVQPLVIKAEGGKLLGSLYHVFGHAEPSQRLFRDAHGDPYALVRALLARAAAATPGDASVVLAEFETIRSNGIPGELDLAKISDFEIKYERAKTSLAPSSRPPEQAEVELINLIAFRDATIRESYALRTAASVPTDFHVAIEILKAILTSRRRAEELDAAMSDQSDQTGLAATRQPSAPPPSSACTSPSSPPSADKIIAAHIQTALAAALEKLGVADPYKPGDANKKKGKKNGKGGKDGDKVKVPRNEDGRIKHWVDGMAKCKCGGKHLYRD